MSGLAEIELAVRRLSAEQRRQLLLSISESLRKEGQPLPRPRDFSSADLQAWIDEDDEDLKRFRGPG